MMLSSKKFFRRGELTSSNSLSSIKIFGNGSEIVSMISRKVGELMLSSESNSEIKHYKIINCQWMVLQKKKSYHERQNTIARFVLPLPLP
jgi:hypothetical protein